MSLERFTNKDDILIKDGVVRGIVWRQSDIPLLQLEESNITPTDTPVIELHAYTRDTGTYIIGGPISDFQIVNEELNIDIAAAMSNFGVRRGEFEAVVNIHRNILGSPDFPMVFIREISGDRRELILKHVPVDNPADHANMIQNYLTQYGVGLDSFLSLNFGDNRIFKIINQKSWLQDDEFVVKLYEPLPDDIDRNDKSWIVQEVAESFIDNIIVYDEPVSEDNVILRGANFAIDPGYTTITETEFKSWNDLLGSNLSTSQQILDSYFSGSLAGVDLGIDYSAFDNFVFYSSARERLDNFKYKLELIEYYSSSIATLQNASGSDSGSLFGSIASNQNKLDAVKGGFDSWERWLYNEPTSSLTTFGESGSFVGAQRYHITPWPKRIENNKYILHKTTSELATTWYNTLTGSADLYDILNESALVKSIPEHIRNDVNNSEYDLFVNMIGHHFDILYTYINKLSETYKAEENPKLGVSRETLTDIAESLGWKLANGKQASALWQYKLGTDVTGSYSQTGTLFSKADQDITTEVWRRIVNNLPFLLKTKGTARSVKALMNTYGIPQTLLSIREYGGPKVSGEVPTLIEDRFNYALETYDGARLEYKAASYTSSLFSDAVMPDNIKRLMPISREFRFKPAVTESMQLLSIYDQVGVSRGPLSMIMLQHTASYSGSSDYGRIVYTLQNGSTPSNNTPQIVASDWFPAYNGEFWNLHNYWTTTVNTSAALYNVNANTTATYHIVVQSVSDSITDKVVHRTSILNKPTDSLQYQAWGGPGIETTTNFDNVYVSIGGVPWAAADRTYDDIVTKVLTSSLSYLDQDSISTFSGSIQEYREWVERLDQATFDLHTKNPTSYVGSLSATSSYETLVRHYPLGTNLNAVDLSADATIISSSHPNQSITDFTGVTTGNYTTSGSNLYAYGFQTPANAERGNFTPVEETYYIQGVSLGGNNPRSQKIRLENNELVRRLSPTNTGERSSFDTAPLDSNKLGLFYSHADQINKDIFNHIGDVELDDYIGNPEDEFEMSYPELRSFSKEYWKKYSDRNDVNAYIRIFSQFDFTLFNQIKQLLPERVDEAMGLLIEPHALERSKVQITRRPTITNPQYEALIPEPSPTASGEYLLHEAVIDDITPVTTGEHILYEGTIPSFTSGAADYCTVEITPPDELVEYTASINNITQFALPVSSTTWSYSDNGLPESSFNVIPKYKLINLLSDNTGTTLVGFNTVLGTIGNGDSSNVLLVHFDTPQFDTHQNLTIKATTKPYSDSVPDNSGSITLSVYEIRNNVPYNLRSITQPIIFPDGSDINISASFDNVLLRSYTSYAIGVSFSNPSSPLTNFNPMLTELDIIASIPKVCRVFNHAILDKCRPSYEFKQVVNHFSGSGTGTYINQNAKHAVSQSLGLYYSQSLIPACYMDDVFAQIQNARYDGCKLTGPGINANTTIAAINNKPVVEVFETNANQLIFNASPEPVVPTTQNTSTPVLPPGNISVR